MSTPTAEAEEVRVRAAIEAGICPWCDRGPFVVLAGHTTRVHDIDRLELRERAGLTYSASVCDPRHAERCGDLARERTPTAPSAGGTHNVSPAGRAAATARLAEWRSKVGPEAVSAQCRQAARSVPREAALRGLATATENRRKIPVAEYAAVVRLYNEEGMRQVDIAKLYGVTQVNISEILRRAEPVPAIPRRMRAAEHRRKVQPSDYAAMLTLSDSGATQRDIAERFGVTQSRVSQILRAMRAEKVIS